MTKSGIIQLRISPELKEQIAAAAAADNRTMSNWIENLIRQALEDKKKEQG